ncbi:MAG: D-alanyl-D-alanine carboxypeptidase family protein [Dongiaceae bacterium]
MRSFLFAGGLAGLGGTHPALAAADYAAIVVDADSGTVLDSHAATARWYPASLTKMMTVYLAFETVEAGTLALDEDLPVSEHAAAQPATELGLGKDETIAVKDAILAVILQSANDAAVVLAERMGGSEEEFAALMTAKAKDLGMRRTLFRNATGLPDPEQVTTARDMAVLAAALLQNYPQYYHFFSTTSFSYGGQTFGTLNGILSRYQGADGIKTGFTCGSGYNLVASAQRDGRRVIGVLLGSHSSFERSVEMDRLLDVGFATDLAKLATTLQLADLGLADDEDPEPPTQLSATECAYGVSATSTEAGLTGTGIGSGWALIFGASANKAQAQKILSAARQKLKPALGGGRAVIAAKQWEGTRRYSALLTGLSKEQAGKACKHLWSVGTYCLALSPQVLKNPQALWR